MARGCHLTKLQYYQHLCSCHYAVFYANICGALLARESVLNIRNDSMLHIHFDN